MELSDCCTVPFNYANRRFTYNTIITVKIDTEQHTGTRHRLRSDITIALPVYTVLRSL